MIKLQTVFGAAVVLTLGLASIRGDQSQTQPASAVGAPPADMPGRTLHIEARIDGSDVLDITHETMTWTDLNWGPPKNVKINGVPYDHTKIHNTPLTGALAFLRTADFSSFR